MEMNEGLPRPHDFSLERTERPKHWWGPLRVMVALALGLFGMLFDAVWVIAIATVWFGPCLLRAYADMWRWYIDGIWNASSPGGGACWLLALPFFLAANMALTPLAVVLFSVLILLGTLYGMHTGIVCYHGGVEQAAAYAADLVVGVEIRAVESSIAPGLACCHGEPGVCLTFVLLDWAAQYREGTVYQRTSRQRREQQHLTTEAQAHPPHAPEADKTSTPTGCAASRSRPITTDSVQLTLHHDPPASSV
jgi:hypothetical protein